MDAEMMAGYQGGLQRDGGAECCIEHGSLESPELQSHECVVPTAKTHDIYLALPLA